MVFDNNRISARQLYRLIIASTLGITCLLTTDISIHFAGRDGIFCIIGAAVLSVLYGVLILFLCGKVKWNYNEYAKKHFSNAVNKTIYFIFLIKYFILLVLSVSVLLRLIRDELLTEVGYIYVLIPILLLMVYSVSRGMESRARMTECMVYFMVIPVIILAVLGISGIDRFYFAPVFNGNIKGIIKGSIILFLAFSPLEMILFMSGDNLSDRKSIKKSVIYGIVTIFVFNLVFYLISVGNLSSNIIMTKGDSVIRLAKSLKLPYLVFEKQGGLFMIFFIISLFMTIFCLSHHMMSIAEKLMGTKNKVSYAAIVLITFIGIYITVNHLTYFNSAVKVRETRVEIENREYADCMIIGYEQGRYVAALAFPMNEGENRIEEYKIKSLYELKDEYGTLSNKRLDLSHVQVIILNERILKDEEKFKEVLSYLEYEHELSDSLNVCSTKQSVSDFMEKSKELSTEPGKYISRMLENNIRYAKTRYKKVSKVMYGAEDACLLSVFSAADKKISYDGNFVINRSGYVSDYDKNSARIMELATGGSGMEIGAGDANLIKVEKNNCYMNVDIIGNGTIHVKLIYSGRISRKPGNEYDNETESLNIDEINDILEVMIFDAVNPLSTENKCDLLGIYKRLAVADRKLWKKYGGDRDKMYDKVFIEVEARYVER